MRASGNVPPVLLWYQFATTSKLNISLSLVVTTVITLLIFLLRSKQTKNDTENRYPSHFKFSQTIAAAKVRTLGLQNPPREAPLEVRQSDRCANLELSNKLIKVYSIHREWRFWFKFKIFAINVFNTHRERRHC